MASNIAQINAKAAGTQALVNQLCKYFVGHRFASPDSQSSVSVVDLSLGSVARGRGKGASDGKLRGSDPVVMWTFPIVGNATSTIYYAPTGSSVKAEHLLGAYRGRGHELISLHLKAAPWVAPLLDPNVMQAMDFIDLLADQCAGRTFTASDAQSSVTITGVDTASEGATEPTIIWRSTKDGVERGVYFLPTGSITPNPDTNPEFGLTSDLLEFNSEVIPWLGPVVDTHLGRRYPELLSGREMVD